MMPETFFIRLISSALQKKATDIHLRFEQGRGTIEFRTHRGLIQLKQTADRLLLEYIKYRAQLDLLTGYAPQTGQLSLPIGHQTIHLRVAYLHTLIMDHVVIRILNPPQQLTIASLFRASDQRVIIDRIQQSSGLVLIAGSTGSGKTTTLYTLLNFLASRKVVTIEDPIETHFSSITQIQINPRQGLTFDSVIKQVLRHDPDIIVIGEIRDETEAKAALRSALTGHLVLSTIHARSARLTIDRLMNLGLNTDEIQQSLLMVIYQQLIDSPNGREMHYELYP
jgi:competence protein ComGA